ncbi:uncharacterized mitochondrial protein AtMg00810-like [Malus sylvestris]|uniref:uncharacterized mitochondrial protein AtMg00810-like n=1 Tax=Malus sylvestris TaxID=3752 RepID=UPI0021ABB56E|nr:uncharacterized mitochondrial protein AtMg00810-like [Malus sylvestris]
MGKLTYFLGLQIQYRDNRDMFISQAKYAKELIKKAEMESCKPTPTPSKPHTQLLMSDGQPLADIVSAFQYLTFTRPDIAYSVNVVANINTTRSITGYVVYLGLNPISWQSKK